MSEPFPNSLTAHQSDVKSAIQSGLSQFLQVVATCQISRKDILDISKLVKNLPSIRNVIAFVPAAGAASRYMEPFAKVIEIFHRDGPLNASLYFQEQLKLLGDSPLPEVLKKMSSVNLNDASIYELEKLLSSPKAIFPCVLEGLSFLDAKLQEHKKWDFISDQVFIAPDSFAKTFEAHIEKSRKNSKKTVCLEQGKNLSTLRFDAKANPIYSKDGSYSYVPAGHGRLVLLFKKIKELFPQSSTLLIRNIDNIQGDNKTAEESIENLVRFHSYLLSELREIRLALKNGNLKIAEQLARSLHTFILGSEKESGVSFLQALQKKLFHTPQSLLEEADSSKNWQALYDRPLNVLGQVPMQPQDHGGTPCFIRLGSDQVKICLEGSHISPHDRQKFLEASENLFFNPVCIAAELRSYEDHSQKDHPFKVISKKVFQGKEVYYHEELLSEVLGNSLFCNCVFVSLPRSTFNPHKTMADSRKKTWHDWFSTEAQ